MGRMSNMDPKYPMGLPCPKCKTGEIQFRGIVMTCMGFACPGGDHDHDDNRKTFYFDCSACAWEDQYNLVNVCPVPGCPWVSTWAPSREKALPQHRYIPPIMHSWNWSRTGQKCWPRFEPEPIPAPYVAPPPPVPGTDFFLKNSVSVKCEERIHLTVRDPERKIRPFADLSGTKICSWCQGSGKDTSADGKREIECGSCGGSGREKKAEKPKEPAKPTPHEAAALGDGPGTPPYSIWGMDQFDGQHYPIPDKAMNNIPDWKTAVQKCEEQARFSRMSQPGGMPDRAYIKDKHGRTFGLTSGFFHDPEHKC